MNRHIASVRWELLQKEMDFIEGTVKNLDDIIYKTKNFAFVAWGGSLYLLAEHPPKDIGVTASNLLYLLTGLIPLLFWIMDFRWRKHLLKCGKRKRIIADFVNSADFDQLIIEGKELQSQSTFPFYDPVGWIFTQANYPLGELKQQPYARKYLVDERSLKWYKVAFYKDAFIFYGALTLLSVVFFLFRSGLL